MTSSLARTLPRRPLKRTTPRLSTEMILASLAHLSDDDLERVFSKSVVISMERDFAAGNIGPGLEKRLADEGFPQ